MNIPANLLYTKDHEWARVEPDGSVVVGITHFAQQQLGGVVYVELPSEDDELGKGDAFGHVESTKSVSDLFAPLSGTVVEANDLLELQPELINSDPYGRGWMVRLTVEEQDQLDELLTPAAYGELVAANGQAK